MSGVDVVVPSYNYARYLEPCVGTILSQEGVEVRVLIIDDASSDDTEAVGRRLAERDKRVEYRRHLQNRGHIATYNEGLIEWASAKYSLLLSADDALAPGALARAARLMDERPEVGMTFGMCVVIVGDEAPPASTEQAPDARRILPGARFLQHCFADTFNPVPTPTAVVRTELQHRLGGYRADYPHTGDLEMWLRFASESSIGVLRTLQGYYRWHPANMSQRYYRRSISDLDEVRDVFRDVLQRVGARFPESASWAALLTKGLARHALLSASRAFNDGRLDDCKAQLEFAEKIFPGVRSSSEWWRLLAKRLLGTRVWNGARPLLNRVRRLPPDSGGRDYFWSGLQIGWWPEEAAP